MRFGQLLHPWGIITGAHFHKQQLYWHPDAHMALPLSNRVAKLSHGYNRD
jgi:hypothetical protein